MDRAQYAAEAAHVKRGGRAAGRVGRAGDSVLDVGDAVGSTGALACAISGDQGYGGPGLP